MPAVMNPQALRRWACQGHRHNFGGDSSSAQTTTNTDARVVGGDDSENASVVGNTGPVSITTTDFAAVNGALQLAMKGVEQANNIASTTVQSNASLLDGALRTAGQQSQQFAENLTNIKGADVRVLVVVGVAVVGVVAAVVLMRKG